MNTKDITVWACVYPSGKERRQNSNSEIGGKKSLFVGNRILLFAVKDYRNLRPFLLLYGN